MLKGCNRRVIMVKDTGSRYFDSAYFILRNDLPPACRDSDMISEAHRMIDAYNKESEYRAAPKKRAHGFMPWLVAAGCMVLVACAVLFAVLI